MSCFANATSTTRSAAGPGGSERQEVETPQGYNANRASYDMALDRHPCGIKTVFQDETQHSAIFLLTGLIEHPIVVVFGRVAQFNHYMNDYVCHTSTPFCPSTQRIRSVCPAIDK